MVSSTVTTLKFVGTISLGLLTGLSYTLSTLTVPTLITLPSASAGSRAFADLKNYARRQLKVLTWVSAGTLLSSFLLSPRHAKHPYLLWTSFFLGFNTAYGMFNKTYGPPAVTAAPKAKKTAKKPVEQSYDTLGDSTSDGTESEDLEEDINGEEIKAQMEQFGRKMMAQTAISGISFAMSLVGLWGDGA